MTRRAAPPGASMGEPMGTVRPAPSLRILVLTNLYPPHYLGGYELGCYDIVERLRARGHMVEVLTSAHGLPGPRVDGHVQRRLSFRPGADRSLSEMLRNEWREQATLRRLMRECPPDVLYVFSLYGVSHGLLLTAQRTGRPMVYAFSGEWLEPASQSDPWLRAWASAATGRIKRQAKRMLGRLLNPFTPVGLELLDLREAYFTSVALRGRYVSKGFPVGDAPVIYWGVDVDRFHPPRPQQQRPPLRLLFAGRIAKVKGLHTAIQAMHLLKQEGAAGVVLDVAGPTQEPDYLSVLQGQIAQASLQDTVRFLGEIPWQDMPGLYAAHDALVFPSIWEEPFSIGLLEAMACGQVVVGTTTGGSAEVLEDGVNSLVFRPDDPVGLAQQVKRLFDMPLRRRIGMEARRTVERRFTASTMMDRIEMLLREVAARRTASVVGGGEATGKADGHAVR